MNLQREESAASHYLRHAGTGAGQRYHLALEEFAWLVEHSSAMSEVRLELLRALQAALPRSGDPPAVVAGLKDLLTDLIIMQSRVSGRDEELRGLLRQLIDSKAVDGVPVEESQLSGAVLEVLRASARVEGVADSGTHR